MLKKLTLLGLSTLGFAFQGFAQDGNFEKISFNELTKSLGASQFSGWGLNQNPSYDVRPNQLNNPAFVINHHQGLTFSAHSVYGGIRFYNQGFPIAPLEPSTGATMVMSVTSNNVGVRTTNPRAPLDVGLDLTGGKIGAVLGRLPEGDNTGDGTFLGVKGYSTNSDFSLKSFALEHSFYGVVNSSINFFRGNSTEGGFLTFNTSTNLERMRIDPLGNVGIGTALPKDKLSVKGNIRATEIRVESVENWPDYVFTKAYRLPTLDETEQHIKEKGHLPGIPSAETVKSEGISLGAMNAKLLEKIEELTLHLIQERKENAESQQQLKTEISLLSERLKKLEAKQ